MFKVWLIFIVMVFISGCASVQPVFEQADTVTVTEVVRDTTVLIQPDKATVTALFQCDSLNQVVMTNLAIERGRKIEPMVKWKDKILTVTAPVDSEQVYISWKEQHVFEQKAVTTIKTVEKKLSWWQKQLMYAGAAAIILVLLYLAFKLFK